MSSTIIGHLGKITAQQHRRNLRGNPTSLTTDKQRALNSWALMAWNYVRLNTSKDWRKRDAMVLLLEMANMIWDAQSGEPLFHFVSEISDLPMSWNKPQYWSQDAYIHYQIGHVIARNGDGTSHPNNLCFQSARCNEHLQASLDLDEAMEYFENIPSVKRRVEQFKAVHTTAEWQTLLNQLQLTDAD